MLPGPIILKKCSVCSATIKENTILSGNTFGATLWTDGYCESPMLPNLPQLVKCPNCGSLIWMNDLEIIDEVEFDQILEKFPDATGYSFPESDDFAKALESMKLNNDKEKYLRIQLWWAYNHSRRWKSQQNDLTNSEQENLEILLKLLNPNEPEDRIMMIEILRELSRFEEAEKLAHKPIDDLHQSNIDFLRELINKKDCFVREFPKDDFLLSESVVLVTGD